MKNTYFLGTVLPELVIDAEPDLQFQELINLFRMNMSQSDLDKVAIIRTFIDLENIKRFLQNIELDSRGNLTEKQLDEALLNKETLPSYVFDLFDQYETTKERLSHFSRIFVEFFKDPNNQKGKFLTFYFNFEREWRQMLVGYRAKKLGRDLITELQYEDFGDPFVAEILAQKDSAQFEFPYEYEDLGLMFSSGDESPLGQYKMMVKFRFDKIKAFVENTPFSIDWTLAYLTMFNLVHDYHALDNTKGQKLLNLVLKESV